MGSRREGRWMALQTLYLVDTCHIPLEEALKTALSPAEASSVRNFAVHLANGVQETKARIDLILAKYAQNWDLNRMATVDRNILRIATFEILFDLETPLPVIIDEAIEAAKAYSTEDSGKFVNGILDKVKMERPPTS